MQSFQKLFEKAVASTHKPRSALKSWQWADENIDYSLVPNYDTPFLSRYDSSRMPFWRDILDDIQDPSVREIAIRKCSRAGYSESVILTDLRFSICEDPALSFYITAKEDLTKGFMGKRVIRGMDLNAKLAKKYRAAKYKGVDIHFPEMDFRATWVANKTATKQDGYQKIYVDEIDLFPDGSIDAIRRRCSAYAMHTIVWGGSIDFERRGDPDKAPIIELYEESDKRVHMMTDERGADFFYQFSGLKWDKKYKTPDGWDIEAAAESAYYETPSGCIIREDERIDYMKAGRWVPTASKSIRRGYLITAPMIPFFDCSFHELTKRFLSAHSRQHEIKRGKVVNPLRVYFSEFWSQTHRDKEQAITESGLAHCEGPYEIGDAPKSEGWQSGIYCTVDVQKHHVWWVARCWSVHRDTGEVRSALVDYGNAASFEDLDQQIGVFRPSLVGIDIGYALRQTEVADYCARYTESNPKDSRVIAMRGSDSLKAVALSFTVRDATEGRTNAGGFSPYLEVTWSNDVFRSLLMDDMNSGARWQIPNDWPDDRRKAEYARQVTSTKKVDGEWVPPKHGQDHLWDCEAEQMVLARWDGLI